MSNLKAFYEKEKESLEGRLREERERSLNKLVTYQEEYDMKI